MDIPEELKGKEISLSSIGLSEVAWRSEEALLLIEYFERKKIFILGGDVIAIDGNEYQHNYDSWYINTDQGSFEDSIQKAKAYISNYPKGKYAFVFIAE